jgi:hypothetical protein
MSSKKRPAHYDSLQRVQRSRNNTLETKSDQEILHRHVHGDDDSLEQLEMTLVYILTQRGPEKTC